MNAKISPQEFYNKFASDYDSTLRGAQVNAQYVKEAVNLFQKYHRGMNGSILDLGCGTGILKDLLEGTFDYTGIDVSENMLYHAQKRGYKTVHRSIEEALPEIPDLSYDFVIAIGSLLFVEDFNLCLKHIHRISCQSILLSLDTLTKDYIDGFGVPVFNHSKISIPEAQDDFLIRGWTSPSTGVTIKTRVIYISKNHIASSSP
ncbi:MAG: class I SAM-dependent methyltransferase [Cyanobacteria bacterium P01_H01_bin.15]